jgi:hypothetical protein
LFAVFDDFATRFLGYRVKCRTIVRVTFIARGSYAKWSFADFVTELSHDHVSETLFAIRELSSWKKNSSGFSTGAAHVVRTFLALIKPPSSRLVLCPLNRNYSKMVTFRNIYIGSHALPRYHLFFPGALYASGALLEISPSAAGLAK